MSAPELFSNWSSSLSGSRQGEHTPSEKCFGMTAQYNMVIITNVLSEAICTIQN